VTTHSPLAETQRALPMFWKRPSLIVGRHGLEPWTADAVQWLSDNGPQYTATATVLYAHELGLVPITTPAYSPESNGLAEAFVGTFKRDYLGDADLRDAETVLAQLGQWIEDYNSQAPHSALGMRGPREYRAQTLAAAVSATTASTATPHLPQDARSTRGPLSGYPPKIGFESVRASS